MGPHGPWAIEIKKDLAATVCNKAHVFPRYACMLPKHLQDVRADGVIMTYKPCKHARQHHAIVHHHITDRSQVGCYSAAPRDWPLAGVIARGYDPTRRGYATNRSPRVKADGTKHVVRRPNHHQDMLAFNILAVVYGSGYPRATCRVLGHSIIVRAWTIKGWTGDRNGHILFKASSTLGLKRHTTIQQSSLWM
jgi:hypothetical protein